MSYSKRRAPHRSTRTVIPNGSLLYVVDGGVLDLGLVEAIASQFGEQFCYVENVSEVQQHLNAQPLPIDVVVLDLSLSDDDPLAMVRQLRHEPAAAAIVVVKAARAESGDDGIAFEVYAHTPYPTRLGMFELGIVPSD